MDPVTEVGGPSALADPARENQYLRQRVLDLQDDVTSLSAENERLRQVLERMHGRRAVARPDPLGGGQ
jgi:hypothetical protein